jgi:hypothetical protein
VQGVPIDGALCGSPYLVLQDGGGQVGGSASICLFTVKFWFSKELLARNILHTQSMAIIS